jgi:hypothetical protein
MARRTIAAFPHTGNLPSSGGEEDSMTVYAVHSSSARNPAFRLGVFLGVCFSGIGLIWLLLANRVPQLDQFALERNLVLTIAFGVLGLVPACRFVRSPARSFLSGITAWTILALTYSVAEILFPRLATRLSAFHLFVLGSVVLGLMAAFIWVMNLVIALGRPRQQADRADRSQISVPVTSMAPADSF